MSIANVAEAKDCEAEAVAGGDGSLLEGQDTGQIIISDRFDCVTTRAQSKTTIR